MTIGEAEQTVIDIMTLNISVPKQLKLVFEDKELWDAVIKANLDSGAPMRIGHLTRIRLFKESLSVQTQYGMYYVKHPGNNNILTNIDKMGIRKKCNQVIRTCEELKDLL